MRIDAGDQALFFGDYDLARDQYLTAYNDSTDFAVKAAALWGLGTHRTCRMNITQAALDRFNTLITNLSRFNLFRTGLLPDGSAYDGSVNINKAADAYNTYLTRVPGVLDGYVQEYRGDALTEAQDYASAITPIMPRFPPHALTMAWICRSRLPRPAPCSATTPAH